MKLKTKKGAAKRFVRTANGFFKRHQGGKSHLLSSKNRERKRRLKKAVIIKSKGMHKRLKRLLPYK